MPSEDINKGAGSQFLCITFERLLRSHSSPEGNAGKKKDQRTLKKKDIWSPLTMKIAFPKSDLILLGRNGNFKFIG